MDLIYQQPSDSQSPTTMFYDTYSASYPSDQQQFPATLTSTFSPGSVDDNISSYSQPFTFSSSLPDSYPRLFMGFSSPPHTVQDFQNDPIQDSPHNYTYGPFDYIGSSPQPFNFVQNQPSNHYGYELSPIENTIPVHQDILIDSRSPQSVYSLESNISPPVDISSHQQFIPNIYPEPIPIDFVPSSKWTDSSRNRIRSHNHSHNRGRRTSSVPSSVQGGIRPRRQAQNSLKVIQPSIPYAGQPPVAPVQPTMASLPPIQIDRVAPRSHHSSSTTQAQNRSNHQKRLDDQLERVNFDDITVSELKDILRAHGLPASGRKADLMGRLKKAHKAMLALRMSVG
ncbi:hypothetical protein CLU79DRAFT_835264 [Phycomyces nitens]|nr:hypothetical protein CLU79DRAFT_835264 [Phycomyces nitens]